MHKANFTTKMQQMITPDEARRIVLEQTPILSSEAISHADALHRVLATDIVSSVELPPFDNSAMDGYAVIADDLQSAANESPVGLQLLETVGAGQVASEEVQRGTCSKIMTGATMPLGADAVVMREVTEERDGTVFFSNPARLNQNIRYRGNDVKQGEKVLLTGTHVRASEWAMLAALGCAKIEVFSMPRVGIITTGEELVDVSTPLKAGQIRDSNSYSLDGLCRAANAITERAHVGDSMQLVREKLQEYSSRFDCIVTSGGVSAGDFDPVRDALFELEKAGEATIHFWKIAMKPGKPVMFATLKNGVPIFGLPGNPVSVMVSCELLVRPALLKMAGRKCFNRVQVPAGVLTPLNSPSGKVEFVRAYVRQFENGWQADVTSDQSSGRLSTMTRANALLIIPADVTRVESGQILQAQMTDWSEI